jgi:membrane protein YqaA with SNARE-associated domain
MVSSDVDDERLLEKKNKPVVAADASASSSASSSLGKRIVSILMGTIICLLVWDTFVRPPEDRWLTKETSNTFLRWVQARPYTGLLAFLLVIALCVVFMVPLGTPLTVGCGYIYKGVYGWSLGITVATCVATAGSALGAVLCFLLGRYLMRDRVRMWIRKYPLFDAIDVGE